MFVSYFFGSFFLFGGLRVAAVRANVEESDILFIVSFVRSLFHMDTAMDLASLTRTHCKSNSL